MICNNNGTTLVLSDDGSRIISLVHGEREFLAEGNERPVFTLKLIRNYGEKIYLSAALRMAAVRRRGTVPRFRCCAPQQRQSCRRVLQRHRLDYLQLS